MKHLSSHGLWRTALIIIFFARNWMCEACKASIEGRTPRDTVIEARIILLFLDMCLINTYRWLVHLLKKTDSDGG